MTLRNVTLISIAVVAAATSVWNASTDTAGDFEVYCAGLRALDAGTNVYSLEELARQGSSSPFSVPNPAIVLPLVRPACAAGSHVALWTLIVAIAFVAAGILDRTTDWPLLGATMFGGFASFFWMLATGNIAPYECLLVGIAMMSLATDRRGVFASAIGAAAFFKTVPAALIPVVLLADEPRRAWRTVAGAVGVAAGLYAVFFAVMPGQFVQYWVHLLGLQEILVDEVVAGGEFHPSILSLGGDISRLVTGRTLFAPPIYLAIVAAIAWDFLRRVVPALPSRTALALLAALAILLVFPRLKPYSFNMALVPLYLLMKPLSGPRQLQLVGLTGVFPLVAAWVDLSWQPVWVFQYAQLVSLAAAYLILRKDTLNPAVYRRVSSS